MGAGWGEVFALPCTVRRTEGLERSGLILNEHSVAGRGREAVSVISNLQLGRPVLHLCLLHLPP